MDMNELQEMQDTDPHYCPACDSGDAQVMGTLGYRVHLRCNGCGWEFSHTIPALDDKGSIERSIPTKGYILKHDARINATREAKENGCDMAITRGTTGKLFRVVKASPKKGKV